MALSASVGSQTAGHPLVPVRGDDRLERPGRRARSTRPSTRPRGRAHCGWTSRWSAFTGAGAGRPSTTAASASAADLHRPPPVVAQVDAHHERLAGPHRRRQHLELQPARELRRAPAAHLASRRSPRGRRPRGRHGRGVGGEAAGGRRGVAAGAVARGRAGWRSRRRSSPASAAGARRRRPVRPAPAGVPPGAGVAASRAAPPAGSGRSASRASRNMRVASANSPLATGAAPPGSRPRPRDRSDQAVAPAASGGGARLAHRGRRRVGLRPEDAVEARRQLGRRRVARVELEHVRELARGAGGVARLERAGAPARPTGRARSPARGPRRARAAASALPGASFSAPSASATAAA